MSPTSRKPVTDDLDRNIIQLLLNDARLPSSQIARELGVPEPTVRYRVRRLKAQGRIVAMTMPADAYQLRAVFLVKTVPGKSDALVEQLRNMPCVTFLARGTGVYDIFVNGAFDTPEEYLDFQHNTLGRSETVIAMETMQFVQIVTRLYGWSGFPAMPKSAPAKPGTNGKAAGSNP